MKSKNKDLRGINEQTPFSFYVFIGFIILFLPFFYLHDVQDQTKVPRLLALCIFLFCFAFAYRRAETFRKFDFSVFRHALFQILAGYFLVTLISMLFAFNYKESIFDVVKTFVFISLVALGTMLFINTDNWQEKIPKFVLVSALIACSIGFGQYYTRVLISHSDSLSDGRPTIYAVDGIMSHKNLFSLSLMMMLPFIAYGIHCFKGKWKAASVAVFIMVLLLILLLRTRAVWVGLGISVLVMTILLILQPEKFKICRKWRNIIITGTIVILVSCIVVIGHARHHRENSTARYLISIADSKNELNVDRLKVWSLTIAMIKEHFLTGVGAGNWQINTQKYYRNRISGDNELAWIRPHNDYLWVMAEKGIAGIILFILIFALVIYYYFFIINKSTLNDRVLSLFLLGGTIGYMIASVFDFPVERPYHQAFFSFYLISALVMVHKLKPREPVIVNRLSILVPFLLLIFFGVYYSYSAVRQEIYIQKATRSLKQKDWQKMLYNLKQAEFSLKNIDQLSNPVAAYVGKAYLKLNDLPAALTAYNEAYRLYPDNVNSIESLAVVKMKLKLYDDAETLLQKGLNLFPDCKRLLESLSDIYYSRKEYTRAYITTRSIPEWQKDSRLTSNIRMLEDQLGIADRPTSKSYAGKFDRDESIDYYISRIMQDPSWLKIIRKKCIKKKISLQEMIKLDAEYMADRQVSYFQSKILKDSSWTAMVSKKAISKKKNLQEMIRLDAEYMVSQRLNYFKSKIEVDPDELERVINKAMNTNKSLNETIINEARNMFDNEITNEK